MSVSRARNNFPKWKIKKSTWKTKRKVRNTGKNLMINLLIKQKHKLV